MQQLGPRRTIIEVRFVPQLKFFSQIFSIGPQLAEELAIEDWAAAENAVLLIDRKSRRRIFLEFNRFRLECDGDNSSQSDAIGIAWNAAKRFLDLQGNQSISRIGVREFYAIKIKSGSFERVARRFFDQLIVPTPIISESKMRPKDLAITVDLVDDLNEQKHGKIQLGPMQRDEWLTFVKYEAGDASHLRDNDIKEIVETLPEFFVFADIDKGFRSLSKKEPLALDVANEYVGELMESRLRIPKAIVTEFAL